jgi:hypothetical protein
MSARTPATAQSSKAGERALFLADTRVAFSLANEARCRTLEWMFGIERADANLLTAIVALIVANSMYEKATAAGPPRPPSIPNIAMALGALRETIYGVAGPASRDTAFGGTLVALAVFIGLTHQPVKRSLHAVRSSAHRLDQSFRGRYGYLVPRRSRAGSSRPG